MVREVEKKMATLELMPTADGDEIGIANTVPPSYEQYACVAVDNGDTAYISPSIGRGMYQTSVFRGSPSLMGGRISNDEEVVAEQCQAIPSVIHSLGGADHYEYGAEIEIVCRDSLAWGPDQGLAYPVDTTLPATSAPITNTGSVQGTIGYLCLVGAYAHHTWPREIDLVMGDGKIRLVDELCRGDVWKLDRNGQVVHSYQTDFSKTYTETLIDFHTHPGQLLRPKGRSLRNG